MVSFPGALQYKRSGRPVRVGDILVDEEAAPTTFDGIEMLPLEGNAWIHDLRVV